MKIGLYFGSFNPIHNGHLIIANKMYETIGFDEVWFVPSPHNPFKKVNELLDFSCRLQMIQILIEHQKHLKLNAIEDSLPKPSYTIQTIEALEEMYPKNQFHIIMGSDILETLDQWRNYQKLLEKCPIHVYYRPGTDLHSLPAYKNVKVYHLPLLEISSTSIRKSIQADKSIIGEVDSKIMHLIRTNGWYL